MDQSTLKKGNGKMKDLEKVIEEKKKRNIDIINQFRMDEFGGTARQFSFNALAQLINGQLDEILKAIKNGESKKEI